MTPDLLSALRPHLTLFGPAEPNPASADPVVARAIVLAGGLSSGVAPGGASGAPNAVPETALARIRTAAQGPDNAEFFRTAIARVTSEGYALLAWGTNDIK
jgi:general secretion pathway protein K